MELKVRKTAWRIWLRFDLFVVPMRRLLTTGNVQVRRWDYTGLQIARLAQSEPAADHSL